MRGRHAVMASAVALLAACQPTGEDHEDAVVNEAAPAPAEIGATSDVPANGSAEAPPPPVEPDDDANGSAGMALPPPSGLRFVGRWAADAALCKNMAWRFTERELRTPAGSVCSFTNRAQVPGGYDISARCTAEGPPADDTLKIRFAESAQAMLFDSDSIADAGLVYCGPLE